MKLKLDKRISRSTGGSAAILLFLTVLSAFMFLPLLYTVLQSLKPIDEIFVFPPRFFVKRPTLMNYRLLFSLTSSLWVPFSRYLFNSIFIASICTAIQVIIASMAAYPLAKHDFPGKKLIFGVVVLSLLFAYDVVFLPQYILVSSLRLVDTYLALIFPVAAFPLGLYLMRQNLIAFPDSLLEAARIDGAREAKLFWGIIMPSMKPVWMTMIVFSFGGLWGRSDASFIYSEEMKNLITLLGQLSGGGIARAGVSAATAVIMILPPIAIFILTQSNVIETMANSGMKE